MPDFIILISAAPACIPIFQFPTVNISLHSANCRGYGMLLKLLVMNGLYKLKWYHGKEQKNYCEQKKFHHFKQSKVKQVLKLDFHLVTKAAMSSQVCSLHF